MSDASEIYTLPAEAAAARLRGLLTTEKPPSSGAALKARLHQPPSEIVTNNYKKLPYKQRMWSPAGVDGWAAERQPPRMRKAFVCLDRLEWELGAWRDAPGRKKSDELLIHVLAEILAAGDEP